MRVAPILLAAIAIAGCHRAPREEQRLDTLDRQLVGTAGNLADPAMAAALNDRIMVDPTLAPRTKPGTAPSATAVPAARAGDGTAAGRARVLATRSRRGTVARCAGSLRDDARWADRLPAGITIYPGAAISEAAGSDDGGCALRIVSFTSTAPVAQIAGWYRAHAGGYAVEDRSAGGRHLVTGDAPDRAFALYLDPRKGGGTAASLIVEGGR